MNKLGESPFTDLGTLNLDGMQWWLDHLPEVLWGLVILIAWSLTIKGIALWKAARNGQRNWYIALLVVNTVGLLELMYIAFWQKQSKRLDR